MISPASSVSAGCDEFSCALKASVSIAVSSKMVTLFCHFHEVFPVFLSCFEGLKVFVALLSFVYVENLGAYSIGKLFYV